MYEFYPIKQRILGLLVVLGLSLTFGYEAQAINASQYQVELIQIQTYSGTSDVSYTSLVQQIKNERYLSFFTASLYKYVLQYQHAHIKRTLDIQKNSTHSIQQTTTLDHIYQQSTLSDDTDTLRFLAFLA